MMPNVQELADAATAGDANAMRRILHERADLASAFTDEGWSMLHLAATPDVAALLLDAGAGLNVSNRHDVLGPGNKPLHSAVYMDRPEVVDFLLERGANVDATDRAGWTPLHIAVANGRLELARKLLERGANPNARLRDVSGQEWSGKTPIELLAVENRTGEGPSNVSAEVDDQMRQLLIAHGGKAES